MPHELHHNGGETGGDVLPPREAVHGLVAGGLVALDGLYDQLRVFVDLLVQEAHAAVQSEVAHSLQASPVDEMGEIFNDSALRLRAAVLHQIREILGNVVHVGVVVAGGVLVGEGRGQKGSEAVPLGPVLVDDPHVGIEVVAELAVVDVGGVGRAEWEVALLLEHLQDVGLLEQVDEHVLALDLLSDDGAELLVHVGHGLVVLALEVGVGSAAPGPVGPSGSEEGHRGHSGNVSVRPPTGPDKDVENDGESGNDPGCNGRRRQTEGGRGGQVVKAGVDWVGDVEGGSPQQRDVVQQQGEAQQENSEGLEEMGRRRKTSYYLKLIHTRQKQLIEDAKKYSQGRGAIITAVECKSSVQIHRKFVFDEGKPSTFFFKE